MSDTLALKLSKAAFDDAYVRLDGIRPSTDSVKIPRATLVAMLMDHASMIKRLRECQIRAGGEGDV